MKKLFVVGLGPGSIDQMTGEALEALKRSTVIAGYTVYVDLVKEHFKDKEFIVTPMKKEADRCKMAVEEALKDKTVAMVCSGDAGVYGMAALIYEMAEQMGVVKYLDIEIVAGVTAACSGGA